MKTKQPIYAFGQVVPEDVVAEMAEEGISRGEVEDFFEFLGFAC